MSKTKMDEAVKEYLARRSGAKEPPGHSEPGGYWYPDKAEIRDCCSAVKDPKESWIYSLRDHCKTLTHVATLYGVSAEELKAATLAERKKMRAAEKESHLAKQKKKVAEDIALRSPVLRGYAQDNIVRLSKDMIRYLKQIVDDYEAGQTSSVPDVAGFATELEFHRRQYEKITMEELEAERLVKNR